MCKKLKGCGRKIDKCIKVFIKNLNECSIPTYASCCGHGKYPMSVIVKVHFSPANFYKQECGEYFDLISGVHIPRKKKFYKKDKEGYYYIPEVVND
jgi:hypothetical protein